MNYPIIIVVMLLMFLLQSCYTVRNEVCVNIDVWEEVDSKGVTHVVVHQRCMNVDDWNRL